MSIKKIEIQDSNANIYYPHTTSDVVFDKNGKNIQTSLNDFDNFKKDYVVNNGFAKTTGTSTIYNVTLNPAPTSYVDGFNITIIPHTDCGDNPKLNVNGLGVTTILKQDGTDIKVGEIKANKPLSLVRVGSNFFLKGSGFKLNYKTTKILYSESTTEYSLYKATKPTHFFGIKLDYSYGSDDKMWTKFYNYDDFTITLNDSIIITEKLSNRDGIRFYNFTINAISDTEFLINISYEESAYSGTLNRPTEMVSKIVTTTKKTNIIDSIKFKTEFKGPYDFNFNYYTIES